LALNVSDDGYSRNLCVCVLGLDIYAFY